MAQVFCLPSGFDDAFIFANILYFFYFSRVRYLQKSFYLVEIFVDVFLIIGDVD